jgi:hypothetical protein
VAEAAWDLAPAEVEEGAARAVARAGAAARAAPEVCGRPASRARQRVAAELVQAALAAEGEPAVAEDLAADPVGVDLAMAVVPADLVVARAEAESVAAEDRVADLVAAGQAADLVVVDLAVAAAPAPAGEQAVAQAPPVSRGGG